MKFAARFTEVGQYSILILEKWQLDSLGKRQPSDACRDSGLLDVDGNEDPASGSKRSSREDEPPASASKRLRRGFCHSSDGVDLEKSSAVRLRTSFFTENPKTSISSKISIVRQSGPCFTLKKL